MKFKTLPIGRISFQACATKHRRDLEKPRTTHWIGSGQRDKSGCVRYRLRQNPAMHPFISTLLLTLLASLAAVNVTAGEPLKRIEEREFGTMPDGTAVKQFTLRNAKGMTAKVISYGATITELQAPDRNGAMTNVVLGANTLQEYLKGVNAAAVIGRVANRIAKARFTLYGVEYNLAANNGPNH
ncbi:MAG: hypothetical protein DME18_14980, partial [Verrucomicrobia bacterium]